MNTRNWCTQNLGRHYIVSCPRFYSYKVQRVRYETNSFLYAISIINAGCYAYEIIGGVLSGRVNRVLILSTDRRQRNGSYMLVEARSINVLFDTVVTHRQFRGVIVVDARCY